MKVRTWLSIGIWVVAGTALAAWVGDDESGKLNAKSPTADSVLAARLKARVSSQEALWLKRYEPYRVVSIPESVSPIGYVATWEMRPTVIMFSKPLGKSPSAWDLNICTGPPK